MFETSVVRAGALQSRGRYSLLTISLIAHSAVIVGAVAVSIASVDFPRVAPNEVMNAPLIVSVSIPPPLGNPNGGAPPKPAVTPPAAPKRETAPAQVTAPETVPETVTPVDAPSTGTSDVATGPSDGRVPGPIGVPWGDPNSPGSLDAPPVVNAEPVPDKIYTIGADVKAPVLITRIEPVYPAALTRARMPGKVALRCIIDKNGRIRDAQVLYATMPPFADSVLRALEGWRYKPASMNGTAVDCYLDLTVTFGIR